MSMDSRSSKMRFQPEELTPGSSHIVHLPWKVYGESKKMSLNSIVTRIWQSILLSKVGWQTLANTSTYEAIADKERSMCGMLFGGKCLVPWKPVGQYSDNGQQDRHRFYSGLCGSSDVQMLCDKCTVYAYGEKISQSIRQTYRSLSSMCSMSAGNELDSPWAECIGEIVHSGFSEMLHRPWTPFVPLLSKYGRRGDDPQDALSKQGRLRNLLLRSINQNVNDNELGFAAT
ncbi:hypothetical protein ACOME3_007861 [Neoechinorhynchus agilis]